MIKRLFLSLALLEAGLMGLLLLIMSCNKQKNDQGTDTAQPLITMEKTVCFGTCPVYKIQIAPNGMADYFGEMHVPKIGHYRKQLSSETIDELIRDFQEADFWSLRDEYVAEVTDLPTTYLSFQYKGKYKKVKDLVDAPQHLTDLEAKVASIGEGSGWEKVAN